MGQKELAVAGVLVVTISVVLCAAQMNGALVSNWSKGELARLVSQMLHQGAKVKVTAIQQRYGGASVSYSASCLSKWRAARVIQMRSRFRRRLKSSSVGGHP